MQSDKLLTKWYKKAKIIILDKIKRGDGFAKNIQYKY